MSATHHSSRASGLGHGLSRMRGRNPDEEHRAATPLELLFDLAFVVAFSQASSGLAHLLAGGHYAAGIGAFSFSMFAICWAWINFSWFASAFDTDDWFYRITTMVQMIGVVILALGIPAVFSSIEAGEHLNNGVVVAGYVVMRIAMVAQWLRVARDDPEHRSTALAYAVAITIAQIGWIVTAILSLPLWAILAISPVLYLIELAGPVVAERRNPSTPWHPQHIAERYSLLAIIALGEVVLGTVTSVSAVVEEQGWTGEAALVVIAGIGLTFGLWWSYFILPSAQILAVHRGRAWVWGYGHIILFASIAAMGAGLHVAADVVESVAAISEFAAVVTVAVPVLVFSLVLFALYAHLAREFDWFHVVLLAVEVVFLAAALGLAAAGASMGTALIVVMLAPAAVVVGFETIGHQHEARMLARALQ